MLRKIISALLGRATDKNEAESPQVPAQKAPRQDKRKLKRAKRRASPGARKIDPNGPWLEQARGAKNGR
ncbi:hypothetical protein [Cupriavidus sp. H18C2]|uniref:hypothetical protein n=1 Tax=Cupriavidus sp. H18C2 TaxID=3241602 RepID=UPI003BF789EB